MASVSDYIVTDDLSILLGIIAAAVFLLRNLYKPQSLVHPILLGRQSDVARVRNPGESAVYRNYGTGLTGRFPVRPDKDTHLLSDFVKSNSVSRTLWSTKITNFQLKERVSAFGTGLLRICGLVPYESNVLVLLNDGLEFLISDLALASHSIPSFTISSASLLSPVLDSHPPSSIITHASFLHHVIELIYDSAEGSHHTIIVVGEPDPQVLRQAGSQVKILKWTDVESEGVRSETIITPPSNANDVFTVAFFESASGQLHGAQLTHENLIAGVTATRALLPSSNAITPLDTIVSAHSLSTAFGRAILYMAVFDGANFTTFDSTKLLGVDQARPKMDASDVSSAKSYPIPSPTIAFIKPNHLYSLTSSILQHAKSALLYTVAWRHKLAGITEGFITKDSMWDRLIFDAARAKVIDEGAGTLRGVIVSGGPIEPSNMTPSRIAFSVPIVNAYTHPLVAGPVLASHPLDLQFFPSTVGDSFSKIAHVGPPSINVEVKLVGIQDERVENGEDPAGIIQVRGPSVGNMVKVGDADLRVENVENWVSLGEKAQVRPNGSFKVFTD
jgi:long-chain acyl-CoA synthetase